MKLVEVPAANFALATTLNSGQVFHWEEVGRGFYGMIGDEPLYVEQRGAILHVAFERGAVRRRGDGYSNARKRPRPATTTTTSSQKPASPSAAKIVQHYFGLDHPLAEICASFPRDPIMSAARNFCRGLRIIRQPKWECLATFICSQRANVPRIRQMSRTLRQQFGKKKDICGENVFSFPSAERLARTSENDLRNCGVGYRAKTLLATAKQVASGEADLTAWNELADGELRERLCQLPGVGAKVANCVMLFAYERVRAFPIDVWIERALRMQYFSGRRKVTRTDLAEFAAKYFGPYGGYAQQYLFHQARMTGKTRRKL